MADIPQHPGRAQQQQEGYPPNPKLIMANQASVDETQGRQARIEGEFMQKEQQKQVQVEELAVAIASGNISDQEIQQLPPELVQRAVEVVQSQQIPATEVGRGIEDPGLPMVEQQDPMLAQAQAAQVDPFDQGPAIAELAQAIQSGAISDQELQQVDPELVQAAVQMIQGQ